jgi:hypothetical protein
VAVNESRAEQPRIARWLAPLGLLLVATLRRPRRSAFELSSRAIRERGDSTTLIGRVVLTLAALDWLVLGYLFTLMFEVVQGSGPRRAPAAVYLALDATLFLAALVVVRGELLRGRFLPGLVYRLGIVGAILGSFFELQWILPAASGPSLDAELHALDLRLFGVEPAQVFDRFVHPATTEWFSFFYYGYFFLLAAHLLPVMLFMRDERTLQRFGFGVVWLYAVGHIVYTIVPAYGPYAHLAFEHPLVGRLWWPLVERTVASVDGSARTDVFPSLHTAGPTFLALFSFQHRARSPFRYTWAPLAFIATQIILATMFLRWHYLVDVFAGVALAVSGVLAARIALAWDAARCAAGGPSVFPPPRLDTVPRTLPGRAYGPYGRSS